MTTFLRNAAWAAAAIALAALGGAHTADADTPHYREDVFPPWQHGRNSDATKRGFEFTVSDVDDLADFHGDITDPKLVFYVGGNHFFALAPLVEAFERAHPDYKGRLYWETIPPGLLIMQIEAGGTVTSGNMSGTPTLRFTDVDGLSFTTLLAR